MPDWLLTPQDYLPPKDKDAFLHKSTMAFLSILTVGRQRGSRQFADGQFSPALKLASCFSWVLLLSLSTSMAYIAVSATLFLMLVATRPAGQILTIIKTLLLVTGFSILVLLPAVFLGHPSTALTITAKSLLSVGFVKLLSLSTPWNAIFGAFSAFRIPNMFILALDLTIKYIHILGEIALEMLYSFRLRSVGRNRNKTESLAGIAGMLFLKSRAMAEEVYWAMECRGFTPNYRALRGRKISRFDGVLIAIDLSLAIFFFLLQVPS